MGGDSTGGIRVLGPLVINPMEPRGGCDANMDEVPRSNPIQLQSPRSSHMPPRNEIVERTSPFGFKLYPFPPFFQPHLSVSFCITAEYQHLSRYGVMDNSRPHEKR